MKILILLLIGIVLLTQVSNSQVKGNNQLDKINAKILSGDFKSALKDLSKYIQKNKKDFNGYKYRGIVNDSLKLYNDALKDYSTAIQLSPQSKELFLLRGNLYRNSNDSNNAYRDYSQAITIDSGYAEAFYLRSQFNYPVKESINDLKRVLEIENSDTELAKKAKSLAFSKYQYILKFDSWDDEPDIKHLMVVQIDDLKVWDADEYRYDNKRQPYSYSPPDNYNLLYFIARAYGPFGFPFHQVTICDAETNESIVVKDNIIVRNMIDEGKYNITKKNSPYCDVYESWANYTGNRSENYSFSKNYFLIKKNVKKIKIMFIDEAYTLIIDNSK
ncbi:MAG: hypothetical protein HUU54_02605 [Ignavibacteriaceae bacterium]|nr:hypothetical protein [Ignavibacteriaceae bacterium]